MSVDLLPHHLYNLSARKFLPQPIRDVVKSYFAQFGAMYLVGLPTNVWHTTSVAKDGRIVSLCGRLDTGGFEVEFSTDGPEGLRKCKWCCMAECC